METERAAIIRSSFDSWNDRDLDALRSVCDPNVEYVNPPDAVEPGARRGYAELTAVVQTQWDMLTDAEQTIEELHHRDGQVFTVSRLSRRMPGSDTRLDNRVVTMWSFSGGRIIRIEVLGFGPEARAALEAAGLPAKPIDRYIRE